VSEYSGFFAPPGYESFTVGRARVVAQKALADDVRSAMISSTLFTYASRRPSARALAGRGTAWASTLPSGFEVVVRHSRHGGALAALTGDLFLTPTRAPRELAVALRLELAGVPTPAVIAYAVYPSIGPLARADVATRTLQGADFPDAWRAAADPASRLALVNLLATLLRSLRRAGAFHPDLNLKNIFIRQTGTGPAAYVLDVDRIEFGDGGSAEIAERNLHRLVQSTRKWRARWGLDIDEFTDLAPLADALGVKLEMPRR
jgi:Lipopolysaccharide kinase (Kdo/WaaP) family